MNENVSIVRRAGGWLTALGIVFIILGILAIIEPTVAGLAVAILAGWLLIFGGVAHAVGAFGADGAGLVIWQVLVAVIYFLGGMYLVTHPLLGLGTLTLMLAGVFLAEAVFEVFAFFATRGEGGSAWRLVNAAVTLLLGLMIWRHWPSSATWAIGTLIGVNLMMTGFSRVMLGSAVRGIARTP